MNKGYSEEQIIKAITKHESGVKAEDIYRRLGISNGNFYDWSSTGRLFRIAEPAFIKGNTSSYNGIRV